MNSYSDARLIWIKSYCPYLGYVVFVRRRDELSGSARVMLLAAEAEPKERRQDQQPGRQHDTTYQVQPLPESGGTAWWSSSSELIPIGRAARIHRTRTCDGALASYISPAQLGMNRKMMSPASRNTWRGSWFAVRRGEASMGIGDILKTSERQTFIRKRRGSTGIAAWFGRSCLTSGCGTQEEWWSGGGCGRFLGVCGHCFDSSET